MNENAKSPFIHLSLIIPSHFAGQRLDIVLTQLIPQYSRTRFKTWLASGHVTLNQSPAKAKDKVLGGETILLHTPHLEKEKWVPQALPVQLIYEDEALLIINKPAGIVTHPAPGHHDGTLVNALMHHCPGLQHLPRAGLIHRLDKDTSGLLVVAKTLETHFTLIKDLQARRIKREYEAIVKGVLISGGRIETQLGRSPHDRTRVAVRHSGKQAITHYRVIQRFSAHTHLALQLETGRTHQIRVHMAHLRHPIVGDPIYGHHTVSSKLNTPLYTALSEFKRQALHAKNLGLTHPLSQHYCEWTAPLPDDMQHLLEILKDEKSK